MYGFHSWKKYLKWNVAVSLDIHVKSASHTLLKVSRLWSEEGATLYRMAFCADMTMTWKAVAIVWTPIRHVTLHFRDRHGANSLRHRNCTEITVCMCERKPYPEWLSYRRKSYPVSVVKCKHSLRLCIMHQSSHFHSAFEEQFFIILCLL